MILVEDYKYAIESISKASIHYVKKNNVETTIQNNQSTGLHNLVKGIKECLEAYGWLNGRVADKSVFLSSFKKQTDRVI